MKLTDIPKIFPGGELTRQNPSKRTLAYYEIAALITEPPDSINIYFHQESYCQMLCMRRLGGVSNFLNAIDKFYTSNDFS